MNATSPASQLLTSQNELLRDCDSQVEINQKLRSRNRTEVSGKPGSEQWLPGCFNQKSSATKIEIQRRLDIVQNELPEASLFTQDIYSAVLTGVTLKHVVDSMYCSQELPQFDGTTKKSLFVSGLERMSNFDLKFLPGDSWPEEWFDWQNRVHLANLPISHSF